MNLIDELSIAIDYWKNARKGRSVAILSRITGVSESTLGRVTKKGTEDVCLENAIGIAFAVLPSQDAIALIGKYFPKASNWLDIVASRAPQISPESQEFLTSPDFLVISLLADKKNGTTEGEIRDELGKFGLTKLKTLLDSNMIRESNGKYFCTDKLVSMVNQATLTKMIECFPKLYNEENAEIPRIAVKVGAFRALTLSAVHESYAVTREWEKKLCDILLDEKNHGDIPFFAGLVQNVLGGDLK